MILRFEDLTQKELKQALKDKKNSLRKLQSKIEEMYQVGAYDNADHLDMICDFEIEDIIEIEKLLRANHEK